MHAPTELRVFSPSATETASRCTREWKLNREGWKQRLIYYPELCAVLGDGFSESMRVLNTMRIEGVVSVPLAEVIGAGNRVMSQRLADDADAGRRINDGDVKFADLLPLHLDKAVSMYIANDPLKEWHLLSAEKTYDDYGKCRIDLLAEDTLGRAVFDYKVKVKLDKQWEDKTFVEYGRSNQRFHYQWATLAQRFYIVLVVLGPKPYVKLSPPYGHSDYFSKGLWQRDCEDKWAQMEGYVNTPAKEVPGSVIHESKYGPCVYESACLTHGMDEAAMSVEYVKTERKVRG